eukprot:4353006-Amphidinium_carterae.1
MGKRPTPPEKCIFSPLFPPLELLAAWGVLRGLGLHRTTIETSAVAGMEEKMKTQESGADLIQEALLQNPQYRLFSNTVAAMWNEMISGRPAMLVLRKLCEQHQ